MFTSLIRRLGGTASGTRRAPQPFRYAVLQHASGQYSFAKTYPAHTRLEFERGRVISNIGKHSGLFRAPEPIGVLESQGIIVWEYIEGLEELREVVTRQVSDRRVSNEVIAALFIQCGQALAAIHRGLLEMPVIGESSPLQEIRTGSEELDAHAAEVLVDCARTPLHWDYCCGNLFLHSRTDSARPSLVVLDAMPNHYVLQSVGPAVVAPIYVDIGQMIFSVYCHPRFSRVISRVTDLCVAGFLAGYTKHSGVELDRATAFAAAIQITQMYQECLDRSERESFSFASSRDREFRAGAKDRLRGLVIDAMRDRK